jgi:regulator of replication initiation timing
MFDRLKERIDTLERDLAKMRNEFGEFRRSFAQLVGENHALRRENEYLQQIKQVSPSPSVIRRHPEPWPVATEEGQ